MSGKSANVQCCACKVSQPFSNFRVATTEPLRVIDFCKKCEDKYGTEKLYKTYPLTDPDIRAMVLSASRKRETRRTQEEVRLLQLPKRVLQARNRIITPEEIPAEIKREMAQRELARQHLIPYVKRFMPEYDVGWVHNDIARRLEQFLQDVIDGKSPRLMIFMPPRLGKSTLASDNFISWALGKYPHLEFILGSHSITLPEGFSLNIKDRILSNEHRELFPECMIRADTRAAQLWKTTAGGQFMAAGVGTGIYGKGAHIGIVDDPIKDHQEAMSPVVRDGAWNWFTVTFGSRIAPGGGILVIQTRWHDDDVAGRAERAMLDAIEAEVPEGEFDRWEIVSYPALAEHDEYLLPDGSINREAINDDEIPEGARLLRPKGEALHPARYTREAMLRRKNTMVKAYWDAVYQQNPVPDEGDMFTKSMFVPEPPLTKEQLSTMKVFFTGDLAQGLKKLNDWTVFAVCALDVNDILHILYMWRVREKTPKLIAEFIKVMQEYGVQNYGFEVDRPWLAIKPLVDEAILKARNPRIAPAYYDKLVPIQDKTVRATTLQSRAQFGKIRIPIGAPWVDKLLAEVVRFPAGTHDDQVDALAWMARMALDLGPPTALVRQKKPKSWMDEIESPSDKHFMAA